MKKNFVHGMFDFQTDVYLSENQVNTDFSHHLNIRRLVKNKKGLTETTVVKKKFAQKDDIQDFANQLVTFAAQAA